MVGTGVSQSPAIASDWFGAVTIPSTLGGAPVTSIGEFAFYACGEIFEVTIPPGVTNIGSHAFSNCSGLESISIPSGVKSISDALFQGCGSLESVLLASSVTNIGRSAFRDCGELSSIAIPPGVTSVGEGAFAGCSNLWSVTVSSNVERMSLTFPDIYTEISKVTVREGVSCIGEGMFDGCDRLRWVTIPSSVTSIGENAFRECRWLESVTIPSGVTNIGNSAFRDCRNLTLVTIPPGVTGIGDSAFQDCIYMTTITISPGVEDIGNSAFRDCCRLTSVKIPPGVTNIGDFAFCNCTDLSSVTIPSSVTNIGDNAFAACEPDEIVVTGVRRELVEKLLRSLPTYRQLTVFVSVSEISDYRSWAEENAYAHLAFEIGDALLEGVRLHVDEIIGQAVVWSNDCVHVVLGECRVEDGGRLEIQPGTVVRIDPCAHLHAESGGEVTAEGVVFTTCDDRQSDERGAYEVAERLRTMRPFVSWENDDEIADHCRGILTGVACGRLARSVTWKSGEVHVVGGTLTVPSGLRLTIARGSVVKFLPNAKLDVSLGATCVARGAIFTHIDDDTVGGDTLADGDSDRPKADQYSIAGPIEDDDDTEWRYQTEAVTSGTICDDTLWRGYKVYRLTSDLSVATGAKLTIQPGAIVKFATGCSMTVEGALDAHGTRAAPIVFTSENDDDWGGDTNGDEGRSQPAGGDWIGLHVYGRASLEHCIAMYAAPLNESGIVECLEFGRLDMNGCTIAHPLYDGVWNRGGTIQIANSVFIDCGNAVCPYQGTTECDNCVMAHGNFGYMDWPLWHGGTFKNCIFYGMGANWSDTNGAAEFQSHSKVRNCCFYNPDGYSNRSCTKDGVDGCLYADPKFVDPDNGDFRIASDSPCIDAGDGTVAPELDFYGRPRMDARRVKNTGLANGDGICPDIGIYEVDGVSAGAAPDLTVLSVSGPTIAEIDKEIVVTYVVTNCGAGTASGAWRDVISFVSGGMIVDAEPIMTANTIQTNESVVVRQKVKVPAMQEGDWQIRVSVNAYRDIFESVEKDNNTKQAEATTTVVMAAADLTEESVGTVTYGQLYTLKLTVPKDQPYAAFVTAPSGSTLRYAVGYMPNGTAGTSIGVDGAYVSLPAGTTVYLQVTAGQGGEVRVVPQEAGLTVRSVSPNSFPQSGRVTVAIKGLHFASVATVELVLGTKRVAAENVRYVSSELIQAEFDCAKLAAGALYALEVTQDGRTVQLADAVTVQGVAGAAKLTAKLDMPNALRQGRSFVFYIEYGNTGNLDLPTPVFTVVSDQMIFDTGTEKCDGSVKVLGLGAPGSEGVIRPGESFRLAVKAQVKTSTASRSSVAYSLKATYAGAEGTDEKLPMAKFFSDEYVYWTEDKTQIAEREAVAAKMGATWGEFYANLGDYLTTLGKYGLATSDYEAMTQSFAEHCVTEVREEARSKTLAKSVRRQVVATEIPTVVNALPLASVKAAEEEKLWSLSELDKDWAVPGDAATLRARTDRHNTLLAMDNSRPGDVWIWNGDWYRLYQPTNGYVSGYFHSDRPTVLICHGNLHSVHSSWVKRMAAVWWAAEKYNVNVLAVDWGDDATAVAEPSELLGWASRIPSTLGALAGSVHDLMDKPETALATAIDIPKVSQLCYEILDAVGVRKSELTLIGHSHGGHVAGNIAGKFGKVKRLVGMETSTWASHMFVWPQDKFPLSWSKDNAESCEFYKTSYGMSMGSSLVTEVTGQVFGHCNFMVIPEKASRYSTDPAYFENQELVEMGGGHNPRAAQTGLGDGYFLNGLLVNMDANTAEGRMEAWRHDNVEEWFIETIENKGGVWDHLGYNWWKPASCYALGLPMDLPEGKFHGVINRTPGHEGLELREPKDWNGEWRYESVLLNSSGALSGALTELQENVTQAIEYRMLDSSGIPDKIDDDHHKIAFVIKNAADNHSINYDDVARDGQNKSKAPWEKDLGYGVWLCRYFEDSEALPPESERSIEELKTTCKFQRIKKCEIKDVNAFVRPEKQATKQFSLSIPEKFLGHAINDEGEDFLLVVGAGVSLKTEQPKDYCGDLCPSNNWFVKMVNVKPTTLQAVVGLNGNDYEDGDTANILIGKDQKSVKFSVNAINPGKKAKTFQWVSVHDPHFSKETAQSTTWTVDVPESEDSMLTAVTLIVSDDKGKERQAMVLVRITRKTEEPDGGGYGGGSSSVPQSCDPNEMVGPEGAGDKRYVKPGDWMTYTVFFENKADAAASAQFVTVENELSEHLDRSTFEMLDVGFGTQIDMGLEGLQNGMSEVEMEGTNLSVRTEVALDIDKGVATWFMRIVSPYGDSEGWPYADDPTGFLPPNDETHCGEGHLTYRIKVRDDAPVNVVITNSATIIFDYNDPIETDPAWWNTVGTAGGEAAFAESELTVDEGGTLKFAVSGGNMETASSVQVVVQYNTAAAADLDLKSATVDGVKPLKGLAFPVTLSWAAGEIGEKTVEIPVKKDSAVENDEFLTLQLSKPSGLELGEASVCTVWIHDPGYDALKGKVEGGTATKKEKDAWAKLQKAQLPYVRSLAEPAHMGKVSGYGKFAKGKKVTLKATANKGYAFAGWYLGGELVTKSASCSFKATGEDADYRARFVTVAEDMASVGATVNGMAFGAAAGEEATVTSLSTNAMCGVALFWPLSHEALSATSVKVSGLPKGLKYDAKKKAIAGTPTAPGKTSSVKVAVTTAGKQKATFVLKVAVDPLPEWARGQFAGRILPTPRGEDAAGTMGSALTMTVGSTGKVSGKFKDGITNWTFSVSSFATNSVTVGGTNLVCSATAKGTYKVKSGKKTVTKTVTAPICFTLVAAPDVSPITAEGLGDFADGTDNVEIRRLAGVRISVGGAGGGTVKMDKSYGQVAAGGKVKLTAKAKKGYTLLGWYDEVTGELLSQKTSFSLVSDGATDRFVEARFAKESDLSASDFTLGWDGLTNLTVGVAYSAKLTVSGAAAVKIASVSGLPKGLSYKSGKVSGVATAAKTNTVSVKVALVTNTKKTWTLKQTLVVEPLPEWATGTFNGGAPFGASLASGQESASPSNQVSVTVTAAGKVSGKLNDASGTWTLSASSLAAYVPAAGETPEAFTAKVTGKNGKKSRTFEITVTEAGLLGCEGETEVFTAWRNAWKTDLAAVAAELALRESLQVADDLVLRFGANGAVTGVLTIGMDTFTCTTTLVPENVGCYRVYLYFAPNLKKKFKGEVRVAEVTP